MSLKVKIKHFAYVKGLKIIDKKISKDSWRYEYIKLRWWFVCFDHYETRFKPLFKTMLAQYKGKGCWKGWLTRLDYWLCWIFLGAEPADYFKFEFFRKGWSWRNHHVTRQRLNFMDPILNRGEDKCFIEEKVKFYEKWNPYLKRKWCMPQDVTFEEFKSLFGDLSRILIKPIFSYGGTGIYALDIDASNLRSVYDQLHSSEESIVAEEYVYQKGFLHEINPSSLNPVRVTTVRAGNEVAVCYAFITSGRKESIVSNISSGGLCFTVDVATGKISTGQSRYSNNHKQHPDTGVEVAGKYMPDWDKIKAFACEAHRNAPEGLDLIGWDICWNDGIISLIEGNRTPGFPEIPNRRENQWKMMKDYLDRMEEMESLVG